MIDRTTPPILSSFEDLTLHFPEATTLDNGIPCYVINGNDDEMNRVSIYFNGGTMMEWKPALATLTAILLTEGNEFADAGKVAEQFDFLAVRKSADSYDYWSEVVMTSLNDNFEQAMRLLFDCITHPSFPEQELDVMKRRIAGNLSILKQRVKYVAGMRMKTLYYGDTNPMGKDITPEDIMSITRDDLLKFQVKYYIPSNCKVIISGKVTDAILNTLNATIGSWRDANTATDEPLWTVNPSSTMLDIVDHPGALQSAIRMRIQAVKRNHPDYLPLRVLIMLFGGYFGSRLMMNIREDKGYTYGIHASLLGIPHDGCIDIQCECATQHTHNVIKETKYEMQRLREELVPQQELDTVKQHIMSELAKTHDTAFNLAGYVTTTILFGVYPEYYNDQLKCITSITPEQLRELARKYLNDDMLRIVIAGDKSNLAVQ